MLIVVDGMTAAGKTTMVDLLAGRLGFEVMQEEFRDKFDLLKNAKAHVKILYLYQMAQ